MASIRVAVRLRPMNKRENDMESQSVVEMEEKKTIILNIKMEHSLSDQNRGEKWKEFSYDFSYWSVNKKNAKYASQEQIFKDLGMSVVDNAYDGYNACVFAYGQTGSGKTYTMMGNPDDRGLIPRICYELFNRMKDESMTYRAEVSYLEIYNEKVRDLLKSTGNKVQHSLRVREHPKNGPYVQDLSKHLVQSYSDIEELMLKGNQSRTTASTCMNDVSSRSHAIFTLVFTQAKFSKESPLERHSKIHLVDLAGSERADATGATGQRLKEGGSINRSLVTLGNVISTLADLSIKPGLRRNIFIPYRDSVLTWLLKDSLGGNSKTMMIATISPAQCNYAESLSTLRYANRAKDIINKPTVNEDANVTLIRELRTEIARLNTLLGGNIDSMTSPKVKEKLHENEAKIKVLTEEWAGRWRSVANIFEEETSLALRKEGLGVVLDSELPHLIGIDDNLLSTGIMLYHLKEGTTSIGSDRGDAENKPDIILQGPDVEPEHCILVYENGDVTFIPGREAPCLVNGQAVTEATPLVQGAVILMGQTNMFRFNHPAQAAMLREEYKVSNVSLSRYSILSQSMTDLCRSTDNLALPVGEDYETKYAELLEQLEMKRQEVSNLEEKFHHSEKQRMATLENKEQELNESQEKLQQLEAGFERHLDSLPKSGLKFEEEKSKLQELIRAELSHLLQVETQRITEVQQQKDVLQKELSEMHQKHEEEKAYLEKQKFDLLREKEQVHVHLNAMQHECEMKKSEVNEKEQEMEQLEREQSALKQIETKFSDYDVVLPHLSTSVTSQLQTKQQDLTSQQNNIHTTEKLIFEEFKKEKGDILANKTLIQDDIKTELEQLEADRIYSIECEDKLSEAFESGEMDGAKYDKEKEALEKEKQRIEFETNKLAVIEDENEKVTTEELRKLDEKRASQITELNIERSRLKTGINEWENLVNDVIANRRMECEESKQCLSSLKSSLEDFQNDLDGENERAEDRERKLQLQIEQCEFSQRECGHAWTSLYEKYEANMATVERQLENYMRRIRDKRQLLESVDVGSIMSETELRKLFVLLGFHSVGTSTQDDGNQLDNQDQQLQMIVAQESKVKDAESDLELVKGDCDIQRERDLDAMDSEKYQLRQLQEQERINSLVDQEMRKRAFEERVEREKQRRIERERERAERDRELAKIKRAHEKELHRMKEKIEESGGMIENTPTRANPYASVMSGDATPVSSADTTRKIKSKSMTNLARTQSITSLHSNLPSKPIKLAVPGFVQRGSGFNTHIDYEIKITVLEETWLVYRRYSRFRELHYDIKNKFPEVAAVIFPPKRWFGNRSDRVASERRILLEVYLSHVVDVLQSNVNYPLHPSHARIYTKQLLCDFHPFFRKGVFENSQHGTS